MLHGFSSRLTGLLFGAVSVVLLRIALGNFQVCSVVAQNSLDFRHSAWRLVNDVTLPVFLASCRRDFPLVDAVLDVVEAVREDVVGEGRKCP